MAKFNLNDLLNSQSKSEASKSSFVTREIPIDNIIPSSKNQYGIREIEELAASIELVGLLHNLVVREVEGGKYELISGERRYKAMKLLNYTTAPCKVEKQPDDLFSELKLIMANSTARELTDYEKTYQAARLKELLTELKESGFKIPGKMRDMIADIMNVSSTQVAIMESINKNLSPEFKEEFKDGKIGISTAYDLSKLPIEQQEQTLQKYKVAGNEAVKATKKKSQTTPKDNIQKCQALTFAMESVELRQDISDTEAWPMYRYWLESKPNLKIVNTDYESYAK